ncbi:Nucleolar complex protein 4 [Nymphon striatum]|nr:Nucleolar complex protein 4 [Nymphon striatum]
MQSKDVIQKCIIFCWFYRTINHSDERRETWRELANEIVLEWTYTFLSDYHSEYPQRTIIAKKPYVFPTSRLIKKFLQEFSSYEDINFNLIKALCQTIKSQNNMVNLTAGMTTRHTTTHGHNITTHDQYTESIQGTWGLRGDKSNGQMKSFNVSLEQLTNILYKKVLIMLHSKVLPHLEKPLLLTDFLISSYDIGGSTSLLALNGLFFLIQNHNLEYPDFYNKLYSLFEPSLFHTKYCARFFHLANIFLTSTYLPIYLVAAFAKRMSRLSLTSPVTKQFIIIPFIGNLLIRHPNLLNMANRMGDIPDMTSDPYNPEEDPANCNAISSSLWEIKDLLSHWHPDISNLAKFIDKPLPNIEYDISETLEISYDELMEKEVDKMKNCPTTFIKPSGSIFSSDFNEWEL